jgi:SHS2 domain-containing protein
MDEYMTACEYEELAHTAEVGLRVRAATPTALFACAAQGMFALLGAHPSDHSMRRVATIDSFDAESLLVDWLSELLYLHETTGEAYDRIAITTWMPTRLVAIVEGGRSAQPPLRSLKAVTYHGLRLVEERDGWLADVYFDI